MNVTGTSPASRTAPTTSVTSVETTCRRAAARSAARRPEKSAPTALGERRPRRSARLAIEDACERRPDVSLQARPIDALASDRRRAAVVTEAQAEEELRDRAVAVVAALVVIAVREGQVADGLQLEGGDRVAADVGGHVADVAADVGVCGAEAGDVAVAERVPDGRVGMTRPERRVVRVVDPDPHGQVALVRLAHETVERVLVVDEAARERPDGAAVGARRQDGRRRGRPRGR